MDINLARPLSVFERCIGLFDEYYRVADKRKLPGFVALLGCEVRERLQQMNWLFEQIQSHETELKGINTQTGKRLKKHVEQVKASGLSFEHTPLPDNVQMTDTDARRLMELTFEIQLYVECFYYFAARARGIIRGL